MVLLMAISRRRSRAVGWRRAMMADRSRSISTLHLVDALFHPLQHLRGGLAAEVRQRIDRLGHLRLDQAAHLEHAVGDAGQLGVELGREVLVAHGPLRAGSVGPFSRTGR